MQASGIANTTFEDLSVGTIRIAKYQKALNNSRVHEIVSRYNEHRMRPIEVSYRDGQYWCFDGQHRLAGYIKMGRATIPCQVHYNLTYEEEAMLFAKQQDNVGTVSTRHKWNALCEAKDKSSIKLSEIALKHGYVIANGGANNRKIAAVKTLQDMAKDIGFDGVDCALRITRNCWNGSRYATGVEVLSGMKVFLRAHKPDPNFDAKRLEDVLGVVTPEKLIQCSSTKDGVNCGVRVAKAIEELYNKKSRGKKRLIVQIDNSGKIVI